MRKIDLSPYSVKIGMGGEVRSVPYDLRNSIEAVVLATGDITSQRLTMSQLLRVAKAVQKIMDAKEDFVLLEEHEYQMIKKGFDAFRGFGRNEVEMCLRISEAETVEVEEKQKGKGKGKGKKAKGNNE
jgi:hypothetical protein